ncbi:hypothetical protein V8G54_012922 [Vigna mungo]|uniref:Uncharacterized protein n=1 Tax=Vigna mungo TaxID=3915 RepID=A0AAQ3NS31_VIGMU
MKGDNYDELVEVFYYNVKEIDGKIYSWEKGVDIVIDDNIWWKFTGLRNEGELSHKFDCPRYRKTRKTEMFKSFMRYQRRLTPMDVCLLYAIVFRIQTNWVAVFKGQILEVRMSEGHILPYGVLISKVLEHYGVDFTDEKKHICGKINNFNNSLAKLHEKMDILFKHFIEVSSSSEGSERRDIDDISEETSDEDSSESE